LLLGVPTLREVVKSGWDLLEEGRLTGYYDDPLTERGDPTKTKPRTGQWWQMRFDKPISDHAAAKIRQFKAEVEEKGGTLVLSLPWVYADREEETLENVRETADVLESIAPTIYDRETLNLQTDSSLFADTHYHLLPEARVLRSRQIIRQFGNQ